MTEQHPITPPPELKQQWFIEGPHQDYCSSTDYAIAQAARWGYEQRGADIEYELQKARDEELEACCAEMREHWGNIHNTYGWELSLNLRAARRPEPPSLKEQALAVVENSEICDHLSIEHAAILRRALESLPE